MSSGNPAIRSIDTAIIRRTTASAGSYTQSHTGTTVTITAINIAERAGERRIKRRIRKERERNKHMNERLRENLTMNGTRVLFSNLKGYVEWQVEEQSNGRDAVEKIKLISVSDKTSSKMNGTLCEFECYRKDGSLALYVSMDERGLLKGMRYVSQVKIGRFDTPSRRISWAIKKSAF